MSKGQVLPLGSVLRVLQTPEELVQHWGRSLSSSLWWSCWIPLPTHRKPPQARLSLAVPPSGAGALGNAEQALRPYSSGGGVMQGEREVPAFSWF